MKRHYIAQKVRTSPKYLSVQVRVEVGSTVRWADVKVPWRLLNEQYQEVIERMEHEANERVNEAWDVPMLPLEKWE